MLQNIIVSCRSSLSKSVGFNFVTFTQKCCSIKICSFDNQAWSVIFQKLSVIRLPREVADRFILNKISRVCFTKLRDFQRYICMKFSQMEITSVAPWLLPRDLKIRRVTKVLTQNIPIYPSHWTHHRQVIIYRTPFGTVAKPVPFPGAICI